MYLPEINCIARDSKTICPTGWIPYTIEMTYKIDGHLINTTEEVYALNGGEASKYGILYVENVGGGRAMKMRVNKYFEWKYYTDTKHLFKR